MRRRRAPSGLIQWRTALTMRRTAPMEQVRHNVTSSEMVPFVLEFILFSLIKLYSDAVF